ncbi:MAG: hypothetical protein UY23_C0001G0124 [Candidatus Jorgensenbacteria bacterium GW2011_GWA1_48_11]|uniref:DUF5667 domain-containing protein n=1 Tax=Candidatus Jorgensenbacteria bacterium GW2011_GWA1_48_11 TaxID=1618660 RepID=A0A0G1WMF6_9BACT|nr:MAG: hypothetical protein UY23_C0001G0124 [Candidatus Jorgensenbacteria bacterium GW2011_GWA1_48_11]KKW12011.1 MAG: hypothetical protein UY51_C0005G0253 [Candidatus Jorgensenbacteria bacterium GW2011_GWB1_49_9]
MINSMKIRGKTYFLWLAVILAAIFAVLAVYFLVPKVSNPVLPVNFLTARQNAAAISQKIVDLTVVTNQKISAANSLDLKNDSGPALALIKEARASNNEAYAETSALAVYLQQMAASLNKISSRSKQQVAYEAVAIELSLVSEFIVYTQKLNGFLDVLSRAIADDSFVLRQAASGDLAAVNSQAQKINALNSEFLRRIQIFDSTN